MLNASTVTSNVSLTDVGARIGLRNPRRRAAALDVHDDERELRDARQPHHLGLERQARPRCRRHRLLPGKRGADGGADPRDLVLRLEDGPAVLPHLAREELHHLRRRCDGVASEELATGKDRGGGAHVIAVNEHLLPRLADWPIHHPGCRQRVLLRELLTEDERPLVGLHEGRPLLGKSLLEPTKDRLAPDAEPTRNEPEHDGVLRLVGPRGLLRHLHDWDGEHLFW